MTNQTPARCRRVQAPAEPSRPAGPRPQVFANHLERMARHGQAFADDLRWLAAVLREFGVTESAAQCEVAVTTIEQQIPALTGIADAIAGRNI